MTLREFLAVPREWRWGWADCHMLCSDWVREATGIDPAATVRGTYSTREEAAAIVDAAGGVEALVASRLEPLGFCRVQSPLDGDIGIVRALTGSDEHGPVIKDVPAIRFGPLWAVMSARGVRAMKLEHGATWRIA